MQFSDFGARLAGCFDDYRESARVKRSLANLLAQRVTAIAPGYEDLKDHDTLRFDSALRLSGTPGNAAQNPVLATSATLGRLEHSRDFGNPRDNPFAPKLKGLENLLVDLYLDSQPNPTRAHHTRHRRHRYRNPRQPGRRGLSRLLRTSLLPATLCLLRASPAVSAIAARQCRWRQRGAQRHPQYHPRDPRPLSQGQDPGARGLRLCPRKPDALVREQPGRLSLRPGAERLSIAQGLQNQKPRRRDDGRQRCPVEVFGHFSHRPKSGSWPRPRQVIYKTLHRPAHEQQVRFLVTSLDWNTPLVIRGSRHFRTTAMPWPRRFTRTSTAHATTWKTGSMIASSTCLAAKPRPTASNPTSCS